MYAFIDQWQTLIGALAAGIIGFAAAIWTIRRTLQSEDRRAAAEIHSIKRALGAEIRQYAAQALDGHRNCVALARGPGNFSFLRIKNAARFPDPVIYPNVANRLGLLGDDAHWVVYFFGQIQVFLSGLNDMRELLEPNSIPAGNAHFAADALLAACEAAVHLLPLMRSDDYYSGQDSKFREAVSAARKDWHPEKAVKFTNPLS